MTQLIFETYEIDDNSNQNDPFIGSPIDFQLGTSDGAAGNGSVLDDINQTTDQYGNTNSSDPFYFTQLGADVLFEANDGVHGTELWITDGTQAGTQLVKDINPGSASAFNPNLNPSSQLSFIFEEPAVVNGEMYFQANDGNGINELWKTDSTSTGTVLVKSFNSDTTDSLPDYMVSFDGELYFVANGQPGFVEDTSASGPQIWKSDGTASGTVQVTSIAPSGTPDPSDGPAGPFDLVVSGSNLFFVWYNGNDLDPTDTEQQLYVLNASNPTGLELTTTAVGEPSNLTNINGELYFTMNDGTHGTELWKSDGTVNGTQLVDDISPGTGGNNAPSSDPQDLTAFNGEVYFTANDGTLGDGTQIWKSNGTVAGTVMVTSTFASGGLNNPDMTVVGNTLFFVANDGIHGNQLWEMNTSGTYNAVKNVNSPNGLNPSELTNINGILYFGVESSGDGDGNELWRSDGTLAGTYEVTNLYNYRNGFSQISWIETPPVVTTGNPSVTFTQGGSSVTADSTLSVTDPESTTLVSATVAITGGTFTGDGDVLGFSTAGTSITASYNSTTETLTLTGTDTLAHYSQVLDTVTFNDTSNNPTDYGSDPTRQVSWVVSDGTLESTPATTTVSITAVNQVPTLTGTANASFTQAGAAVTLSPSVTVSDADNLDLASATVALTGGTFAGDLLAANTSGTSITASYNSTTETLTLSGSDTLSHYQAVLDTVTFDSTSLNPTDYGSDPTRTVTWTLDNGGASNATGTATSTIAITAINDPPTLSSVAASAQFTQAGAVVTLSPSVTVTDPDNLDLASATVAVSGGTFSGDGDVLGFSTAGTSITASYNSTTETLTLTGSDTLAHYQQVLDTVTFDSTSLNPTDYGSDLTRQVTWLLDNGGTSNSLSTAVTTTVSITAVNEPPTLTNVPAQAAAAQTTITLAPNVTVSDPDNLDLASATVSITGGTFTNDGDVLAANTAGTSITASYNSTSETLTLIGSDTLAHYQSVLDTVTFDPNVVDPTDGGSNPTRTVSWVLNNGGTSNNLSTAQTETVSVTPADIPPTLSNVAASASFTQGGAAVTLSPGLTVSDPDGVDTDNSATVSITGDTFTGDGDVLGFSTAGTSITASYHSSTETLTLTGSDTLAHYQSVLESVTFDSTSQNPTDYGSEATRTVTWVIADHLNLPSTAQTETVSITAVNQRPTLRAC